MSTLISFWAFQKIEILFFKSLYESKKKEKCQSLHGGQKTRILSINILGKLSILQQHPPPQKTKQTKTNTKNKLSLCRKSISFV